MTPRSSPLVAVDIGNSRIKAGLFEGCAEDSLPQPSSTFEMLTEQWDGAKLGQWLSTSISEQCLWWIASVNRPAAARLQEWVERQPKTGSARMLGYKDLPITAAVQYPERVGLDRLAGAVAVNRLRSSDRPAIIVDMGSAITVDLISAEGVFLGGAILPGISMAARALHDFTDLLPAVSLPPSSTPPVALGRSTISAIQSGLYWGTVGSVREVVQRLTSESPGQPQVFLTGGAAPLLANLPEPKAEHVPHLVLSGIALATCEHPSR